MKQLIALSSRRYLAGVVNIFLIIVKSYTYVYKKYVLISRCMDFFQLALVFSIRFYLLN